LSPAIRPWLTKAAFRCTALSRADRDRETAAAGALRPIFWPALTRRPRSRPVRLRGVGVEPRGDAGAAPPQRLRQALGDYPVPDPSSLESPSAMPPAGAAGHGSTTKAITSRFQGGFTRTYAPLPNLSGIGADPSQLTCCGLRQSVSDGGSIATRIRSIACG
jgi:hypothetical protein